MDADGDLSVFIGVNPWFEFELCLLRVADCGLAGGCDGVMWLSAFAKASTLSKAAADRTADRWVAEFDHIGAMPPVGWVFRGMPVICGERQFAATPAI
jgi:hypothetical protein